MKKLCSIVAVLMVAVCCKSENSTDQPHQEFVLRGAYNAQQQSENGSQDQTDARHHDGHPQPLEEKRQNFDQSLEVEEHHG